MLKTLTLTDFQKHQNLTIELDTHVTTIIGETESGKSTLLRALRWAALNQSPRGDFIRWGQKSTTVQITLDDTTIIRSQDDRTNTYILDDEKFTAFGKTVPEPIEKLLNIDDNNFQDQLDSPFWFSDTPGQVSKQLNKIVNLGEIDDALSNIAATVRKAKATKDVSKDRVRQAKEDIEQLCWVEEVNTELTVIEAKQMAAVKHAVKLQLLATCIETARRHAQAKELAEIGKKQLSKLVAKLHQHSILSSEYLELRLLTKKAKELKVQSKLKVPSMKYIGEKVVLRDSIIAELNVLEQFIADAKRWSELQCKLKEELRAGLQDLKLKTKNRCPVCLKPMS